LDSGTRHTRVGRQFLRLRDLLRIFGETGGKRKGSRAHGSIQNMICIPMINIAVHPHVPTYNIHTHTSKVVKSDTSAGHHSVHPLEKSYAVLTRYCPNTCVYSIRTYIYIYYMPREKKKMKDTKYYLCVCVCVCFVEVHNDLVLVWAGEFGLPIDITTAERPIMRNDDIFSEYKS